MTYFDPEICTCIKYAILRILHQFLKLLRSSMEYLKKPISYFLVHLLCGQFVRSHSYSLISVPLTAGSRNPLAVMIKFSNNSYYIPNLNTRYFGDDHCVSKNQFLCHYLMRFTWVRSSHSVWWSDTMNVISKVSYDRMT